MKWVHDKMKGYPVIYLSGFFNILNKTFLFRCIFNNVMFRLISNRKKLRFYIISCLWPSAEWSSLKSTSKFDWISHSIRCNRIIFSQSPFYVLCSVFGYWNFPLFIINKLDITLNLKIAIAILYSILLYSQLDLPIHF